MSSSTPFIPPPGAVAQVSIIDTGGRMGPGMPTKIIMQPPWSGFEIMPAMPAWVFLVENPKGQRLLFDLAFPKKVESFSPAIQQGVKLAPLDITHPKDVADVLVEHGIELEGIKDVVWSHHHPDHIGDITTFPTSTNIVVGPGFKRAFLPAYPTNPESELHEDYFKDRTLHEIDFKDTAHSSTIGAFRSYDFFGDGSFYLLNTPGHDHGHLSALARTHASLDGDKSKDTFIFMGGDICHHPAALRPSAQLPFPFPSPHLANEAKYESSIPVTCPGHILSQIQEKQRSRGLRAEDEPFFKPTPAVDMGAMIESITHAQVFDGMDNVFIIAAHDATIQDRIQLFPQKANGWFEKGWKRDTVWKFLEDLPVDNVK